MIDRVRFLKKIGFAAKDLATETLIATFFNQHMILYDMICGEQCTIVGVNMDQDRIQFHIEFETEEDSNISFNPIIYIYNATYSVSVERTTPKSIIVSISTCMV